MLPATEIVSSRGKGLGLLAISLAFVALAIFLPAAALPEILRWSILVFFGLGALVFACLALRPQRIVLDGDGFALAGGLVLSPRKTAWRDTGRFFVYRVPSSGSKMIGFDYTEQARPDSRLMRFNRAAGADGALPMIARGSIEELVDQLNAYRQRALGD